jgi:ATP-binding cassette subfamily C (CFTR/MRP) protein 1
MGKPTPTTGKQAGGYNRLSLGEEDSIFGMLGDGDAPTGVDKPNQLPKHGFYSYLTFSFINPLLNFGFETPLQDEDLYDLVQENSPAHNYKRLEESWARQKPGGTVLMRALFGVIGKEFLGCAVLQALSTVGRFASPLLLQQMVQLIETGQPEDAWHGYVISVVMLFSALMQTAIDVHYNYQMNVLGLRARGGLMCKVFQKAMRLSEPAYQRVGVGKIVNLVQIDCTKVSTSSATSRILSCPSGSVL